ncbi:MAG: hypothetical protein QMD05_08600 [Candidatus Brocadiaceae bacterium]|nr:hypothetical protein [Candidatus Brocadiaceae bacterium]
MEKVISKLALNFNSHREKKEQEELKAFWSSYFQPYDDQAFIEACQRILDDTEFKRFPTVGQIKARLPQKQRQDVANCGYCDKGIRLITEVVPPDVDKHLYKSGGRRAFACTCHAGDSLRKDLVTCELGNCLAYDIEKSECHATTHTPERVLCRRWKSRLALLYTQKGGADK